MTTDADEVWATMLTIVTHNLEDWRRVVSEQVGLPFSRVRVIRRLVAQPLTMGRLAEASGMDAPAASVAVNDLERRGLVQRAIDPSNRRQRMVALTEEGRQMVARVNQVRPVAPPEFSALDEADLEALAGILSRVADAADLAHA
jgi:DNA-binding MarR family transcriptional regulator